VEILEEVLLMPVTHCKKTNKAEETAAGLAIHVPVDLVVGLRFSTHSQRVSLRVLMVDLSFSFSFSF